MHTQFETILHMHLALCVMYVCFVGCVVYVFLGISAGMTVRGLPPCRESLQRCTLAQESSFVHVILSTESRTTHDYIPAETYS